MVRILLLGGGHAHVTALRWLRKARHAHEGIDVKLLNPEPVSVYSGMVPGYVAGHFNRDAAEIDLSGLCREAGADLMIGRAIRLDADKRAVTTDTAGEIGYDLVSIDVGIQSRPQPGSTSEDSLSVKPMADFLDRWDAESVRGTLHHVCIIGGGLGGVELALSVKHAQQATGGRTALIERSETILPGSSASLRGALKKKLASAEISVHEGCEPREFSDGHLVLSNGQSLPASQVIWAAGATPFSWLAESGLSTHNGLPCVHPTLQSVSHPDVFVAGDTADLVDRDLARAGVYAVRQGPVLMRNLIASAKGTALEAYNPQRDYMKLVSLGTRRAVAEKWGVTFDLPGLWCLKKLIDTRFVSG